MLICDWLSPYGLMYLAGTLLLFTLLCLKLNLKFADALFCTVFIALFTIAGGRIGYALFYERAYFARHLSELIELYKGGMSFHGALIGYILALLLIVKEPSLRLRLLDLSAVTALILLPIGRIMNYLGAEIYGTPAPEGMPFAAIYPALDLKLRHAVTLYEAAGYLILVLPLLSLLKKRGYLPCAGAFACAFAICQGILRFTVDFWREPDLSVGLILNSLGLGQILALIQVIAAAFLFRHLRKTCP